MKKVLLILLGVVLLIVDGVILPALTGLSGGVGVLVVFVGFLLTLGVHRWVIGWGLGFAFVLELMLGLYFGSLMLAWVFTCWAWYLASKFLSLKPLHESDTWLGVVPLAIVGTVLCGVAEGVTSLVARWFYSAPFSLTMLKVFFTTPIVLITTIGEMLIFLIVLRYVYASRTSIYA